LAEAGDPVVSALQRQTISSFETLDDLMSVSGEYRVDCGSPPQ
jgi:hypothetical protein